MIKNTWAITLRGHRAGRVFEILWTDGDEDWRIRYPPDRFTLVNKRAVTIPSWAFA